MMRRRWDRSARNLGKEKWEAYSCLCGRHNQSPTERLTQAQPVYQLMYKSEKFFKVSVWKSMLPMALCPVWCCQGLDV